MIIPINKLVVIICIIQIALIPVLAPSADSLADYEVKDFLEGESKKQRFTHRFSYRGRVYRDSLLTKHRDSDLQHDIDTLSLVSDWHPRGGDFHLSAGVVYQDAVSKVDTSNLSWQIPQQISNSSLFLSNIGEKSVSPYVGLGWVRDLSDSQRFGLNFDVGVLYQPDSSLFEEGSRATNSSATNKLLRELQDLELTPAFSLGLSYNF